MGQFNLRPGIYGGNLNVNFELQICPSLKTSLSDFRQTIAACKENGTKIFRAVEILYVATINVRKQTTK